VSGQRACTVGSRPRPVSPAWRRPTGWPSISGSAQRSSSGLPRLREAPYHMTGRKAGPIDRARPNPRGLSAIWRRPTQWKRARNTRGKGVAFDLRRHDGGRADDSRPVVHGEGVAAAHHGPYPQGLDLLHRCLPGLPAFEALRDTSYGRSFQIIRRAPAPIITSTVSGFSGVMPNTSCITNVGGFEISFPNAAEEDRTPVHPPPGISLQQECPAYFGYAPP